MGRVRGNEFGLVTFPLLKDEGEQFAILPLAKIYPRFYV
jgi:hypothetical protein